MGGGSVEVHDEQAVTPAVFEETFPELVSLHDGKSAFYIVKSMLYCR